MILSRSAVAAASAALLVGGGGLPFAAAQDLAAGDAVCIEGYVMDNFCLNLGFLFDNKDLATLDNPQEHSFHCLVDLDQCVDSGYELLVDPLDGGTTHCRGFRLDANGSAELLALARSTGLTGGTNAPSCTSCTNTNPYAPERGFRATVRGTVVDPGDATTPASITVIQALASSTGCGGWPDEVRLPNSAATCDVSKVLALGDEICVEGNIMDNFCLDLGVLFDNKDLVTLDNPGKHSFHCLVDLDFCVDSLYEVLIDPFEDETMHCRGFSLDAAGSATVRSLAQATGLTGGGTAPGCTSCTNTTAGALERGFRATVRGTVTDPGNATTPASITVTQALASSVGCGDDEIKLPLSATPCVEGGNTPAPPTPAPPPALMTGMGCEPTFDFCSDITATIRLEYTVENKGTAQEAMRTQVTRQGEGWIAFGVTPDGKMVQSESVIGLPGTAGVPQKYAQNSYEFNGAGVQPMPDSQQTLTDVSLTQENGQTIMKYTKLLTEPGEIPISFDDKVQFIYAMGSGNSLAFHGQNRGTADVTGTEFVLAGEKQWKSHGIMALTAWGFLTPMAVAASWLRDLIGGPLWFKIHMFFNTLTFLLTIAFFALAVSTYNKDGLTHFEGGLRQSSHTRMGLAMFILVCLQVIGGYARPHNPEEGEKKSTVRVAFEVLHKSTGAALLGCGLWQINRGLELYLAKGYTEFFKQRSFWIWIGCFLGVSLVLAIGSKFMKKKDEENEPAEEKAVASSGNTDKDEENKASFVAPVHVEEA